jgi:hypothetical protein
MSNSSRSGQSYNIAWLKARNQQVRDCLFQQYSNDAIATASPQLVGLKERPTSAVCSPKRKQLALLQEEERKCSLEDQAGTLHISEILHEEDVSTYLTIVRTGNSESVEVDELTAIRCNNVSY